MIYIRHTALLTCTALLLASSFACEKPGAMERQKEQQANEEVKRAWNEATQRAQGAQAAAEREIAAARANFEKTREDYRHARATDLSDLGKKVADLEAKAKTSTGKIKSDLRAHLSAILAAREAFVRDLQALDKTTAAAWDEAKAKLDREWGALKATVDKAQ
jgi:phosphoenolpyruvate-protein kinase (PTS system EI component)